MLLSVVGILGLTYATIGGLMARYGYYAVFLLLLLEGASMPIPSEVVLPLVGHLIATKVFDPWLVFAVVLLGGTAGMMVDYYIAYFLEKDVVYKHLAFFHINRKEILEFDDWFKRNGDFTVFVARLLPVVRGLINFPAGFALMPRDKFLTYSVVGTVIWDVVLIGFGFYALSTTNVVLQFAAFAAFAVVLYAVYKLAMGRMRKK